MRVLGLDVGDRTIGVAVSDALKMTAQGVETIRRKTLELDLARLQEIIAEYEVSTIVVGYPKNMNGTLGERAEKTYIFADRLKEIYDGEIVFFDERLSTVCAIQTLNETNTRGKKRKDVIDTVAAALILQAYMDSGAANR